MINLFSIYIISNYSNTHILLEHTNNDNDDIFQNFRKSLVKMFASRGEDCIFFETVKRLRHFPHMVLQCVPLPRETGDMAPIYFKVTRGWEWQVRFG